MHTQARPFGPVQMLSVAFPGNKFKGEILPALEALRDAGIVRIVDLLLIRKDAAGVATTVTKSDLDWEEATRYGAYIGRLMSAGKGEDAEAYAEIAGAAELADGHFFDEEDAFRLTSAVPPSTSVAMVLIEHLWASPLHEALARSDGVELDNFWLSPEELVRAGLLASLDEPDPS